MGGDDINLRGQSSSEHGASAYQQYAAQQAQRSGDAQHSFRLFGDVEPLPLYMSGGGAELSLAPGGGGGGEGRLTRSSSKPELAAEQSFQGQHSFRLFGDVEPLALEGSDPHAGEGGGGDGGGAAAADAGRSPTEGAAPGGEQQQQREQQEREGLRARFGSLFDAGADNHLR